jgi:DNA-binding CsgD family transcriptional regulator
MSWPPLRRDLAVRRSRAHRGCHHNLSGAPPRGIAIPTQTVVERDGELTAIAEACAAARAGSGRAVLIEGPAGIGKTELLKAGRSEAQRNDLGLLSAVAGEQERGHPYGVVRQLLERHLVELPDTKRSELFRGAAELAAPIFSEAPAVTSPELGYAVLHGLYWLVANVVSRPYLLVVDDVHWADVPSATWLEYLARRLEGMPLLVLLAVRSGEHRTAPDVLDRLANDGVVRRLQPRPLSEAASGEVIGTALGDRPAPAFVAACHVATGGNPYLLQALAGTLKEQAVEPTDANASRVGEVSPETVERNVLLRLSRLGPDATSIARAIAMLGPLADLHLSARLANMSVPAASSAVDDLIGAGILRLERPLDFDHPLVRSAVVHTIAPADASDLHRRAARLLAAEGFTPDAYADHLAATHHSGDPWTVDRLRAAAAIAQTRGASAGAVTYLQRALAEPPATEDRAGVLLELGTAEALSAMPDALDDLSKAHAALQGRPRAAAALVLSQVLFTADRLTDALVVMRGALEETGGSDPEFEATLLSHAINAARNGLRADVIERLMPRLERLAAAGGFAADAFEAHRSAQATIKCESEAVAALAAERALASGRLLETLRQGDVNYLLACRILILSERHQEAERHLREALHLAQRSGSPVIAGLALVFLSEIATRRGDPTPDADARLAIELPTEQGRLLKAPAAAYIVSALTERGELQEAAELLRRESLDGDLPMAYSSTFLLLPRGRLKLALGEPAAAIDDLMELGRRDDRMGGSNPAIFPWRSSLAQALLQLGERERAASLVEEEVELAKRFGIASAVGVALHGLALVRDGRGVAGLEEATSVLEGSPARLAFARALTDLGAALRRVGRSSEARDKLRLAMDLAHRSGAWVLERRAHAELVAAGARPRRPEIVGPLALTPSERRVALMASEGTSNRDIAEALFVTRRTVEIHLTHAYDKLGVESRQGLAEALQVVR